MMSSTCSPESRHWQAHTATCFDSGALFDRKLHGSQQSGRKKHRRNVLCSGKEGDSRLVDGQGQQSGILGVGGGGRHPSGFFYAEQQHLSRLPCCWCCGRPIRPRGLLPAVLLLLLLLLAHTSDMKNAMERCTGHVTAQIGTLLGQGPARQLRQAGGQHLRRVTVADGCVALGKVPEALFRRGRRCQARKQH